MSFARQFGVIREEIDSVRRVCAHPVGVARDGRNNFVGVCGVDANNDETIELWVMRVCERV